MLKNTNTTFLENPCDLVRTTCRQWMEQEPMVNSWRNDRGEDGVSSAAMAVGRRSVVIHKENIPRLAKDILDRKEKSPSWIEWDEENWHYSGESYQGSLARKRERVALYILALDAINFCFWPPRAGQSGHEVNPMEYEHLAVALKKVAEADENNAHGGGGGLDDTKSNGTDETIVQSEATFALSPSNLATMTPEGMHALLEPYLGGHSLDNMATRARLWRELGTSLLEHFHGSATNLLASSENHGPKLVELITTHFAGFRDLVEVDTAARDKQQQIVFLKRAQIFVGDVNAALKLGLSGMDHLTTFADYRVPQILRHFNILEYAPQLAHRVDDGVEMEATSYDEISIRAATVIAVEDLVEFLNAQLDHGDTTGGGIKGADPFTAVGVDWYLWQVGERMNQEGTMKPFHKVRTTFY